MIAIDSAVVSLEWAATHTPLADHEPEHYLREERGQIIASDLDKKNSTVIGKFGLIYVDVENALNDAMSLYDVFDSDERTLEYYEAMYEMNGELKPRLTKLLKDDYFYDTNVLILDRLEVLPAYRGNDLGLTVMRQMIQRRGAGSAVVAIKPFPLQFEHKRKADDEWRQQLCLASLHGDARSATAKLTRYYARLGFVRLPETAFMFLSRAWRLPKSGVLLST